MAAGSAQCLSSLNDHVVKRPPSSPLAFPLVQPLFFDHHSKPSGLSSVQITSFFQTEDLHEQSTVCVFFGLLLFCERDE